MARTDRWLRAAFLATAMALPACTSDAPPTTGAEACTADGDCPDGQVCEGGGQDCAERVCVVGCRTAEDCDVGQSCSEVVCVTCPCPPLCE